MQKILILATFTGLSIFLTGNHQLLAQNPHNSLNSNGPANCLMAQNDSEEILSNQNPNQNMMPGRQGRKMFDPNTVTTISGEIVSVDQITNPRRNSQNSQNNNTQNNHQGIHLTLKSGGETIDVHVGPSWYLAKENMVLTAGDQITIKGSQVSQNNRSFFIAQEITKGNQVLILRDKDGIPLWRGQGGNAGQGMRRQPKEY